MSTPQMPPGVMADTLDFMKNLWSGMGLPGMGVPGMVMPTLSVEELDKKISDLKAVEAWLNLNMTMLRGSIQALEVQRATVSTLQSMGSALAESIKVPEGEEHSSLLASVPYASAFFAGTKAAAEQREGRQRGAAPAGKDAPPANGWGASPGAGEQPAAAGNGNGNGHNAQAGADAGALPNAAAWWSLVQDQFKQAVSAAVGSDAAQKMETAGKQMAEAAAAFTPDKAMAGAGKRGAAEPAAKKAARKPAAKKTAPRRP